MLLDHGALINAKDQQQESPIHVACQRGRENVVKLLLDRGANPNAVRELPTVYAEKFSHLKVGKVAFDAARKTGHQGFGDILDYGVQLDYSDNPKLLRLSSQIHQVEIADRKTEDDGNVTALHLAAEIGSSNMVKLLLESGASVDAQTNRCLTPLLLAAKCRHSHVAQILLQRGACVNITDENNNSPLYIATEMRDSLLVRRILECKPNIDRKVHDLVLDIVALDQYAYHEMVDDFIEHGFRPNCGNAKSFSFLTAAVQNGYKKLVECLLKQGATLGDGWERNATLLNLAVESGEKGMIELFLDLGCYINAKDEFGRTPISYALSGNHKVKAIEIVQLLLDRGASVIDAPTLLHKAVVQQNIDVCKILIENGADVSALDENGMTTLHRVISGLNIFSQYHQRASNVSFGARLEIEDDATRLCRSTPSKREEIVALLLTHGANVESRCDHDGTPLHWACRQGDQEMVKILLNNGANVEALQNGVRELRRQTGSNRGMSRFFSVNFSIEGVPLLWPEYEPGNSPYGLKVNVNGLTPLHLAAREGHADIVATLLQFNADIDAQTAAKDTALHYAAAGSHNDVVSVLLTNGCDVRIENDKGETALTIRAGMLAFHIRRESLYQDLIMSLKKHIIKLRAAGIHVGEKNNFSCAEYGLESFVEQCEKDVNEMRRENLTREHNLCDVLDTRRLCNYLRNESLLRALEAFDFGKYRIYESLLRSSFLRSKLRLEMITSGWKSLNFLMKTSNALNENKLPILPNELLEEIVSYLSKRDLSVIIRCGENLKRQLSK